MYLVTDATKPVDEEQGQEALEELKPLGRGAGGRWGWIGGIMTKVDDLGVPPFQEMPNKLDMKNRSEQVK